ncbi:MAG: trypsin-like peptidase domain-containing protein [Myxococcota bacterium]
MRTRSWFRAAVVTGALVWTGCQGTSSNTHSEASFAPPSYRVACADDSDCPESVALLVGRSAPEEPMRCTAALIGPRTAVTAGHCVAWELSRGGRCDDVWLGFASVGGRAPEWVACASVQSSSDASGSLLAPDYAILRLRSDAHRAPLAVSRGELGTGEVVRMVSVTPNRFYDDVHEVRSRRCIIDHQGTPTAWTPVAPSSVRVLSSCPIQLGNSGAPLLDYQGRMRGLVHAGGPPYFAFGLMTASDKLPEETSGSESD